MDYNHIKEVIDQWDPMELIYEYPDITDEYSSEIKAIENSIITMKIDNYEILASEIHRIFVEAFTSRAFKKSLEDCLIIAKRIYDSP
ncbi:MAG: DUF1871 family protein [Bacillota bacterium]